MGDRKNRTETRIEIVSNKCHGKANIGAFAKDKIDILGGDW